ncbi:MAG: FtsW/RodA/SpoVE family cell cycle protein [Bacteroidales bacterium]|nr:FtsW/RodA/SpoVE family cell cycle protein [Bacteroidales bacterium]
MLQGLSKYFKGDRILWIIAVLLAVFSLLAVYSSTGILAYNHHAGNTEYFLIRQLIIIILGFGIMYVAHLVPYRYYSRISQLLLYIAIPLLLITLVSGTTINQASRWLTLPGTGITFQTSDFAKLVLVMFVARKLAKGQDNIQDWKNGFRPIIIPVLLVTLLILPANFSTAAVIFTTAVVIMFIGRVNLKYIGLMIGSGVLLLLILLLIANVKPEVLPRMETWTARIESFSDDSQENYQVKQSKIAIATGGLLGKMPGKSIQRNYLPHPYSDFIFAIIVEEYGVLGGGFVVLLYLILLFRGIKLANKAPGTFGAFLAIGLSFSLVFQAMINMGVAVNLLPVTGQPLPLISMGGTSIWFSCLTIGIMLSVSRQTEDTNEEKNSHATQRT